jgi:F-type H+-transporting ATPase subunit b
MSRWLSPLAAGAVVVVWSGVALASGGGEGGGHLNWADLIYRAINFAILLGTIVFLARKPLSSALKSRAEGIREELAELEAKREEAKREYALMEKRLKEAEAEREQILAEFRRQGEREYEKIVDNAKAMAERIRAQARFTIEQETAQAKAELRREVAELSAKVAEDLLRENITAEDQARLVGDYLAKVQQEVL